ncbi:threonine-phosphate decarboxylase CobD [Phreatobacter sp.]|uniref:threonine-phosphate decarboxylase CobD n=1 Tax=Phreatobacter sp. TaxID=1966341 RepID=UPI003F72CE5D
MRHGGDLSDAAALVPDISDWIDLSTGINPHAWPVRGIAPRAWTALPGRADLARFLDAARAAYRAPAGARLVAAPGTEMLIGLIPLIAGGGPVAIAGPTYGSHERLWQAAGAAIAPLAPDRIGAIDRHAVIVRPNNPDGAMLDGATVMRIAERCARQDGLLVIDEAFVDCKPDSTLVHLAATHPVVVLRSFGKFHGLAGLRLGVAIGPPEITRALEARLGEWAVSGPALAIGTAALADAAWAAAMRQRLAREATRLDRLLAGAGFARPGGTPLFRLAHHPRAQDWHLALARSGLWTRRFDHDHEVLRFGLPGRRAHWQRLSAALAAGLQRRTG